MHYVLGIRVCLSLLYYALLRTLSIWRYIKSMKVLLWVSVIIAAIIFFQELTWIGKTGLAPVIMGLAVAIGLLAGYLLWKK